MPQPRYPGEGGINGGMLGGFGLAIPNPQANTGTYPEEPTETMLKAWEFMKWWAYDEGNSLEWTKVSASFPALLSLQTSEYIQSDPMMKTCADYAQYQKVRPGIPGWLFIQTNVFNINIPNYFLNNVGLQSVIDKMTEDADDTILTYRK